MCTCQRPLVYGIGIVKLRLNGFCAQHKQLVLRVTFRQFTIQPTKWVDEFSRAGLNQATRPHIRVSSLYKLYFSDGACAFIFFRFLTFGRWLTCCCRGFCIFIWESWHSRYVAYVWYTFRWHHRRQIVDGLGAHMRWQQSVVERTKNGKERNIYLYDISIWYIWKIKQTVQNVKWIEKCAAARACMCACASAVGDKSVQSLPHKLYTKLTYIRTKHTNFSAEEAKCSAKTEGTKKKKNEHETKMNSLPFSTVAGLALTVHTHTLHWQLAYGRESK